MTVKIWRKNFEIKRAGFLLAYEALDNFYNFQSIQFGKYILKEGIWISDNLNCLGTYFVKDELRKVIELTLDQVLNNPGRIERIHRKAINYNDEYFKILHSDRKINLTELSNRELAALYKKHYKYLQLSHGTSIYSTWFIDSDGEDLTNFLLNYTKSQIDKSRSKINFAEAFSLLTTPTKNSFIRVETQESLKVLQSIKTDKSAAKLFLSSSTAVIEKGLNKLKSEIRRKILNHYEKWRWTPYTYMGPAYDLNYYLEIWSGLLRQKINTNVELKKLETAQRRNQALKRKLFSDLKIDREHARIFNLAGEIIWLKAYRKDVLFFSVYFIEKIYSEMAKRFGLSMNQVRCLTDGEVQNLLLKNKVSLEELNRRIKFFVCHLNRGRRDVLTGKKAKTFLARQQFEEVTIQDVKELKGTSASPGVAIGIAKLIDLPEEMSKMKNGDIMVSHATYPALVPAMKKASAIVTDDGGLTCHAAIVARELKTPCVVGTRFVTSLIKDGDKVRVDADNGIIKKL